LKTAVTIALAIVACLTALSAFGGKTWNEGEAPLHKRITVRGWIALGCLLSTLIFATIKALIDSVPSTPAESAQDSAQIKLLARQGRLLAAGRADELRREISSIDESLLRLASVSHVYDKLRNVTMAVTGRVQGSAIAPNLTAAVRDFLFNGCDASLRADHSVTFNEKDCRNNSTFLQVPQVKALGLETTPYGWSFVALLQYQTMIYQDDRKLLNGPLIPGQDARSEVTLDSVLPQWIRDCDVIPKVLHRSIDLAQALRGIARSSAQLHWLFQFGYPTNDTQALSNNEREFEQAMALYSINVSALDKEIDESRTADNDDAYRMGRLTDNIATGYREIFANLQTMIMSCEKSKKRLEDELRDGGRAE